MSSRIENTRHDILIGLPTEIQPGVVLLRLPLPFNLDHINVYLLEDSDGWILVDTGIYAENSTAILERVIDRVCGSKGLKAVLATHAHADHIGAAGWICARWQVPLWVSEAEHQWISEFMDGIQDRHSPYCQQLRAFYRRGGIDADLGEQMIKLMRGLRQLLIDPPPIGRSLQPNETLMIGANAWQLRVNNGHTAAHITLYCAQQNLLISGDQILGRISSNVSVRPDDQSGNPLDSWLDGLIEMRDLPADTLVLPAHEQPFRGLHPRVTELIDGYRENAERVMGFSHTPTTADELLRALYPRELSAFEHHLAYGECLAYINYLLACQRLQIGNPSSDVPLYQAI